MKESLNITVENTKVQKERIADSITQFIAGGDDTDLQKLDFALHKEYRNVQYGFFGKPGVFVFNKEEYISLVKEKTFGGIPRNIEILFLEVHDQIALAKLRLESAHLIFHSFVSLIYDEERWQVIGNFPDVKTKPVDLRA